MPESCLHFLLRLLDFAISSLFLAILTILTRYNLNVNWHHCSTPHSPLFDMIPNSSPSSKWQYAFFGVIKWAGFAADFELKILKPIPPLARHVLQNILSNWCKKLFLCNFYMQNCSSDILENNRFCLRSPCLRSSL